MDDPILEQLLAKLAQADAVWLSTTRPDGRAHLAPIWHIWHDGRIYLVTQAQAVRTRNIAKNPGVSLSLPDPMNVLIMEGEAVPAPETQEAIQPLFLKKYGWDIATDSEYDAIIQVIPYKVLAWGKHGHGRWRAGADGALRSTQERIP